MALLKKAFRSVIHCGERNRERQSETQNVSFDGANLSGVEKNEKEYQSATSLNDGATCTLDSGRTGKDDHENPENPSHVPFDGTTLPDIVAERIATFLHDKDLINLGKTCKFWNDISRKNFVWKVLIEKRFGKQLELEPGGSPADFKKLYFKLGTSKKPATDFEVVWSDEGYHGEYRVKVRDKESEFGGVIQVKRSIRGLQIKHSFLGVLPGRYSLVWRMKLNRFYLNGYSIRGYNDGIEFRARPEKGCGKELCSKWKELELLKAERIHGRHIWYLQTMGEFEVTAVCKVYVEVSGSPENWFEGISWDYVELIPLN